MGISDAPPSAFTEKDMLLPWRCIIVPLMVDTKSQYEGVEQFELLKSQGNYITNVKYRSKAYDLGFSLNTNNNLSSTKNQKYSSRLDQATSQFRLNLAHALWLLPDNPAKIYSAFYIPGDWNCLFNSSITALNLPTPFQAYDQEWSTLYHSTRMICVVSVLWMLISHV